LTHSGKRISKDSGPNDSDVLAEPGGMFAGPLCYQK
jgi:hypothetical protein